MESKLIKTPQISFKTATFTDQEIILSWLSQPHVTEFWDNSLEHKADITHFIEGRKTPSPYYGGVFDYWVGSIDNIPYCLLMTSEMLPVKDLPQSHLAHLSQTGKTFSIDFTIGNTDYLGKGLAAPTLRAFMHFIREQVDPSVDTFFIDPAVTNPRAIHVYEQAGFIPRDEFLANNGYFENIKYIIMVKKFEDKDV